MSKKTHFEILCALTNTDFNIKMTGRNDWDKYGSLVKRFRERKIDDPEFVTLGGVCNLRTEVLSWLALFKHHGNQIYKMGRDFGNQLNKVDLKLKGSMLPSSMAPICIEFPENLELRLGGPRGETAKCAYVWIMDEDADGSRVTMVHQRNWHELDEAEEISTDKVILTLIPVYKADGKLDFHYYDTGSLGIDDNQSIESAIERSNKVSTTPWSTNVINYILKCVLYIHSGDPDLREFRAPTPPNSSKKKAKFVKSHENLSLYDLIYVGYGYKKEMFFYKDSTEVSGHFRWQPYGEGLSKVKLIWIDAHTRNYKNLKDENEKEE